MVVTLEPCPMCAGALVAARVGRLVFGATDPRAGACGTLYNLCADPRLNHELAVTGGVRAEECGALLTSFFAEKRATDRASAEPPDQVRAARISRSEGCESGRIGRSRKPLCLMGTVGSNPTPSAIGSERPVASGRMRRESAAGRRSAGSTWSSPRPERSEPWHAHVRHSENCSATRPRRTGPRRRWTTGSRAARTRRPPSERAPPPTADVVDQTHLLEQFAALHEDLADGRISLDDFEVRQEELRAKLVV